MSCARCNGDKKAKHTRDTDCAEYEGSQKKAKNKKRTEEGQKPD